MFFSYSYSEIYYLSNQDNHITSFDFNPSGELVVTIDFDGKCLLADVNTDSYIYHLDMDGGLNRKIDLETSSISLIVFFFLLINFIISISLNLIPETPIILNAVDGVPILVNPYYS